MVKKPLSEERKQQLRDQLARARAAKVQKAPAKTVSFEDMSVEDRIRYHYQHAQGSIQDLSRIYKVDMDEVLRIIGEHQLSSVATQGDLIDQQEAGQDIEMNYGKDFKVPFSTN